MARKRRKKKSHHRPKEESGAYRKKDPYEQKPGDGGGHTKILKQPRPHDAALSKLLREAESQSRELHAQAPFRVTIYCRQAYEQARADRRDPDRSRYKKRLYFNHAKDACLHAWSWRDLVKAGSVELFFEKRYKSTRQFCRFNLASENGYFDGSPQCIMPWIEQFNVNLRGTLLLALIEQ